MPDVGDDVRFAAAALREHRDARQAAEAARQAVERELAESRKAQEARENGVTGVTGFQFFNGQDDAVRAAIDDLDLSGWLGWSDGIDGCMCVLCEQPTRGFRTYTFRLKPVVAAHRSCMLGALDEGSPDSFEEIKERIGGGGPLFAEEAM